MQDLSSIQSDMNARKWIARRESARRNYERPIRAERSIDSALGRFFATNRGDVLAGITLDSVPSIVVVPSWHKRAEGPVWGVVLGWRGDELWIDGQGLGTIERVHVQNRIGAGGLADFKRRFTKGRAVQLHYAQDREGRFRFRGPQRQLLASIE